MNSNWIKAATFKDAVRAEIIKQMLIENNVPAVVLNKQDSSYFFGNIELYVDQEHELEAIALMDSFGEEDLENEN
ncbi:putative signal transducing protein [Sphingobacterium sp. HJSM2_6]|uniref:putative signal transducing protein n=1 Tax=Sphingobacterium sp. HJSM2_6 TaxID=3366264 RepID=UPI003BDBCC81